jgi:acetylxylan esterase
MGRRRRKPAYQVWLSRRRSLDGPDLSLRSLLAIEAVATLLVVGLILAAVATVGQHSRAATQAPNPLPAVTAPPIASATPSPSLDPSPSLGPSPSARPSPKPTTPATSPAARTPAPRLTSPAPVPNRASHCVRVTHTLTDRWPGGLQAQFFVANCGSDPINGWSVRVRFTGAVTVESWDSRAGTGSSTVDFSNASYNGLVAPGASVTFGFNATWSGSTRAITGCSITGGTCT